MARLTYKAKSFKLTFFLNFLFYIVKIFLSIVENIIDSVNSLGLWNKIFSLYSHFKRTHEKNNISENPQYLVALTVIWAEFTSLFRSVVQEYP